MTHFHNVMDAKTGELLFQSTSEHGAYSWILRHGWRSLSPREEHGNTLYYVTKAA